ncbi:MAG: glycosyltransferase family 4 protein [Muribaculaceae bacterium]|nr:glycosyltransferase family 4 protein [Muribaculaceae bacterium]
MKIVFIGGRDVLKLGGIETYMYNLASHLVKYGHEPIVFCESDHNGEEIVNGFRVIHMTGPKSYLLCKPWVGFKATLHTIRHIKDVDFIHYNAWPPSLSSPLARCFGIKSLMQGHGLEWQRSKYSPRQQSILKFMERVTAHLNRKLIMCSDDQTRYFKKKYNREATTIPTAINLPQSSEKDSDVLQKFGIIPGKYFLFLARLVQDKNPNCLIEAFKRARISDFQLVIAGDNPANQAYVDHLHALATEDNNIIFTGAVYGQDKITLLRHAYGFCLPSTIEGLSISLLEAMSYRLPIIASDISANREVLEKDDAFWHTPENTEELADSLSEAANDKEKFYKPTEQNYIRVAENYTWDKVTLKYIRYLEKNR